MHTGNLTTKLESKNLRKYELFSSIKSETSMRTFDEKNPRMETLAEKSC